MLGVPHPDPGDAPEYQRILTALSKELDPEEMKLLVAEGRQMSLEEAAAYALR